MNQDAEDFKKAVASPKKYTVAVREVHIAYYEVEARSPEEAKEKASEYGTSETALEFSHVMDSDTWTVEEHP